jgi:hypothetical protein
MLRELSVRRQALVRKILRKEFTDFFVTMTSSTERWPTIDDQELVEALADSLIEMGRQRGLGAALLQTFVHELQDRVNQSIK